MMLIEREHQLNRHFEIYIHLSKTVKFNRRCSLISLVQKWIYSLNDFFDFERHSLGKFKLDLTFERYIFKVLRPDSRQSLLLANPPETKTTTSKMSLHETTRLSPE